MSEFTKDVIYDAFAAAAVGAATTSDIGDAIDTYVQQEKSKAWDEGCHYVEMYRGDLEYPAENPYRTTERPA